ncbi:putative ammonium transporter 1 [Stylophora pistillata]|uniref:putative ammonium transporter 1 n=1 Tax=Stylophora pistillata TaxID=50429 RepID=UPI000C047531|nr:putative ammonium transporter 1 [Stylophora pistillata]XP_022793820.1 putative ammonium transporter 1 [Stylophora pistillata]
MDMLSELQILQDNLDHFFLIITGCLIFFMQTGFAFLEAGSVRSKNTTNILIKNFLDVFIGAVAYWLFGYAFAFGAESNSFIGHKFFALADLPANQYSHWFFHFVFAATAATIVSGAMAERTEFKAYLLYSVFLTGFVYPIVTHWAWDGNGWLYKGVEYTKDNVTMSIAYQDFAGSGVVHVLGGTVALIGATVVGPRTGRFVNGVPVLLAGHTVPKAALGGFILFFGFLGFNGGSQAAITFGGDADAVALSIVNTVLGGASGALTAMIVKRLGFADKYWSLLFAINGGLTGMVALCAGCNAIYPYAAFAIGIIAGVAYVGWSTLILYFKIDDPLEAVAVHLGGGFWGVLSVPIFNKESGIFYDGSAYSFYLFGWNVMGVLAIMAWSASLSLPLFLVLRVTKQLRVSPEIEEIGLDIPKHGEPAYPLDSYGNGWSDPPSVPQS